MLVFLRICGLAVFDEVSLELGPGLNVLTGETGAGKSVLVSALGLLRGGRSSSGLVRPGCDKARIEAQFHGPESDDLVLARELPARGRGRAFVQGELVPAAQLARVGAPLIDLCSQHEHHSLSQPHRQGALLDDYGQLDPQLEAYRATYDRWRDAERRLGERQAELSISRERLELMRYQLAELERLQPGENELAELVTRVEHLQGRARWLTLAQQVREQLYDADNAALSQLTQLEHEARIGAERVAHCDALVQLASQLEQARSSCEEAVHQADALEREFDCEPEELEQAEERRAALLKQQRRHGCDPAVALEQLQAQLTAEADAESELAALAEQARRARTECEEQARVLSAQRRTMAPRFAKAVMKQLRGLALAEARLAVGVKAEASDLGPRGWDQVSLAVSCNPGLPAGPLSSVASGGELSRLLLALKTVMSSRSSQPGAEAASWGGLQVFDEVDAGVGGAVADAVGARLRDMAHSHPQAQVLCITHLPQVAALADTHYHIKKCQTKSATTTIVQRLSEAERVEEIARMLGGAAVGKSARVHAQGLLQAAAAQAPRPVGTTKKARAKRRLARAS